MKYDALVVIDVQKFLVNYHPYDEKKFIQYLKGLLKECREKKIPVIYVRHDGGKGDVLEAGTDGWQIYDEIAPLPGEKIIDKQFNSAFRHTDFKAYLDSIGAKNLIFCGMQTEYCIDASCKVAFEYEYNVTLGSETTTTYDTKLISGKDLIEFYENMWNNRYARVIPYEDLVKEIQSDN